MNTLDWLIDNTFWCAKGVDAAQCAGLLQARATLVVGLLIAFLLCLIAGKLKRQVKFHEARFSDHRQAFAQFMAAHLRNLNDMLELGSTPLPISGPLAREEWQHRALLPQKLRVELDKLVTFIVAYNASLQKNVSLSNAKAELSAKAPSDTSRSASDLKKQLIRCQKMLNALR